MPEQLIEFLTKAEMLEVFPHPYPANRALPDWYRQMPVETDPPSEFGTVKRCPPFLEAMSCGYIIPLPADMKVTVTSTTLNIEISGFNEPLAELHLQSQFPGAPFPARPLIKFRNPWIVKTPPGYSTLFVAPLNYFDAPFVPLAGVVETDTYYRHVTFPAIWLLGPGTQTILKRGTPLVQAIPFRRDDWTSAHGGWDTAATNAQQADLDRNLHMYKDM